MARRHDPPNPDTLIAIPVLRGAQATLILIKGKGMCAGEQDGRKRPASFAATNKVPDFNLAHDALWKVKPTKIELATKNTDTDCMGLPTLKRQSRDLTAIHRRRTRSGTRARGDPMKSQAVAQYDCCGRSPVQSASRIDPSMRRGLMPCLGPDAADQN